MWEKCEVKTEGEEKPRRKSPPPMNDMDNNV